MTCREEGEWWGKVIGIVTLVTTVILCVYVFYHTFITGNMPFN